jgi:DNA-directed RNA polymerase specialized sigma24 family protein
MAIAENPSLNTSELREPVATEDAEIVRRFRTGQNDDASALYAKYHRALTGYLLGRAAMAREDAEDIAQDIWLRALPDLVRPVSEGGYDPERGSFYTFLVHRYAKFAALQFVEAKRRRAELSLAGDGEGEDAGIATQLASDDDPELVQILREELEERQAALCQCFRLTFLYGGFPHQVLAFGYSKLIYGQTTQRDRDVLLLEKRRRREVEGDPKRLDAEHGSDPLHAVEAKFWDAFKRVSNLDDLTLRKLEACLDPMRQRLELTVAEMSQGNKIFLDHHAQLAGQKVGATAVRDYYGTRGLNAITDWCDKVQNRVRDRLGIGRNQA